uniref:Uncharacterized protein n=1 Tax=Clytia hemisphaerica TaxID=252671 RepID=A0A7M6DKT4_9CNID
MVAMDKLRSLGALSILLVSLFITNTYEASIRNDLLLASMPNKRSDDCRSSCTNDKYLCLNNPAIQNFSDKFICLEQHRICSKKCNLGKRDMLPLSSMQNKMAADSKQISMDEASLDKIIMNNDVTRPNNRNTFLRQAYERMPKELLVDLLMNNERQRQA